MKYRSALLAAAMTVVFSQLSIGAEEAAPKATTEEKPQKVAAAECQTVTGSRIRAAKPAEDKAKATDKDKESADKCAAGSSPMRTYTKDQLEMTGEMDLADALRKLDPTFH